MPHVRHACKGLPENYEHGRFFQGQITFQDKNKEKLRLNLQGIILALSLP